MHTQPTTTLRTHQLRQNIETYVIESTLQEKVKFVFNACLTVYIMCRACLERRMILPPLFQAVISVLVFRKATAICGGYYIYEASRRDKNKEESIGNKAIESLVKIGYQCTKIKLHKIDDAYFGIRICTPETKDNGIWILNAVGVRCSMESSISEIAPHNKAWGANTLIMNGPSVGQSEGLPTRYHLGAAFEAGLQHLEKVIKAKKIIMYGYSFGGGTLAEAILTHDFTFGKSQNISYLSISDRTFSDLRSIVSNKTFGLAYPLMLFSGLQLDGLAAAKKLSHLMIKQIIIQGENGSDKIIADSISLANVLKESNALVHKILLISNEIEHGKKLPMAIVQNLDFEVKSFMND